MTYFPEYDDLSGCAVQFIVCLAYAFLEPQYHRAGAVDDVDSDLSGLGVSLGRFAVSTDQKGLAFRRGDAGDIVMAYGHKSLVSQSFEFGFVVDYGSQGIQSSGRIPVEEFFRAAYSPDDASAETGTFVYLDLEGHYSRIPNLPCASPWNQTVSSWRVMSELSRT